MDIMVRLAEKNDAEGIAQILHELHWFEDIDRVHPADTAAAIKQTIEAGKSNGVHSIYVAEAVDDHIMGYANVHWLPNFTIRGGEGFISEIYIIEQDRGHGVGTLLLESVKQEARERGINRLRLINIQKQEAYHREFYKKLGWEERPGDFSFEYRL